MEQKRFCRKASELSLVDLGLSKKIYNLIKNENPEQFLCMIRNGRIPEVRNQILTTLLENARKLNIDLAEDEMWTFYRDIKKTLIIAGFIRNESDFVHPVYSYFKSILDDACEVTFTPNELTHYPKLCAEYEATFKEISDNDVFLFLIHSKNLDNERYETFDFEKITMELSQLLLEILLPIQKMCSLLRPL